MSREALIIKTENYSNVHQQVNMQTVPLSIQQSITNNKKKKKLWVHIITQMIQKLYRKKLDTKGYTRHGFTCMKF